MSVEPGALLDKDPQAELPYVMDWTLWLGDSAEIDTSEWFVAGDATLLIDDDEIVTGNLTTQVFLSGGTVGRFVTVTNRITTDETPARTDDRSFTLRIVQR